MLNRRSLLKTFAGTTFAASTMRFFMRTAESGTYPTRFLFLFSQHGRDRESMSTGTGAGFTLGSGVSALEPLKKKITVLDGIFIPPHVNEEHPNGRCAMLTGRQSAEVWAGRGISIDRYLANKLTGGKSVYTGVEFPGVSDRTNLDQPISWEGANAPNNSFIQTPSELMTRVFSGVAAAPAMMAAAPAPAAMPGAADEIALYDHLMAEVSRLQKRAPASQRDKLDLHLQSLQQHRAALMMQPSTGQPSMPLPSCGTVSSTGMDDVARIGNLLAQAFACGQTRVAVFSLEGYEPHHEQSHWANAATHDALKATDKAITQRVLTILKALDAFPEGNGTLLDNMVVVWSSEVSGSYGKGEDVHDTVQMPFVLAGGLGGKLKTGQRIVADGRSNVDLYRTLAQQMGVANASDFGDAAYAKGTITDLLA